MRSQSKNANVCSCGIVSHFVLITGLSFAIAYLSLQTVMLLLHSIAFSKVMAVAALFFNIPVICFISLTFKDIISLLIN